MDKTIKVDAFTSKDLPFKKVGNLWATINISAPSNNNIVPVPAMDFILVIDISGSMRANKKMATVKAAIHYMLDQLKNINNGYRLAVITFNNSVDVITGDIENNGLVSLTPDNVEQIIGKLNEIKPEGATNMSGALETAMELINDREIKNPSTILFFTDGYANVGKMGRDFTFQLSNIKNSMPDNLSIHTFGIDQDHDSTLLRIISSLSKCGIYYYVESTGVIGKMFASCLATILYTAAYNVTVKVEAQKGCRIIQKFSKFPITETETESCKKFTVQFGSISFEESRTILVKLSINKAELGKQHLLKVTVDYSKALTNGAESASCELFINRSDTEILQVRNPHIDLHYWRYTVAATIEDAVREINTSRDEERFASAQSKIIQLKEKMEKEAPEFCAEQFGKDYLHILEEMVLGMKNSQTYSAGIHYADSYISALYLERNTGYSFLKGMQEVVKNLSYVPLVEFERRLYFSSYVTTYQSKQSEQVTKALDRYVAFYVSPSDD